MKRDDPVRRTLARVALLTLTFGLFATVALIAFFPAVPILFKFGIPAVSMMTAANLYALASRPRGEYTRRTIETFNKVYRPLKPLGNVATNPNQPFDESERCSSDGGRRD